MDKEMQQRMIMMERKQHIKTAMKNIDILLQVLSLRMSKMQDSLEEPFGEPSKTAVELELNACIKPPMQYLPPQGERRVPPLL